MGKLVLYLEDGRAKAIPLAKDRIVIGRRMDNDVCLPFPAVSGEHAAVVTILLDSFLEDLGSTNGTLVNGNPITKHFLRDHDEIEIGRQRLVYFADDTAPVDSRSAFALRTQARMFGEQVERIEPSLRERRAPGVGKAPESGERRGSVEALEKAGGDATAVAGEGNAAPSHRNAVAGEADSGAGTTPARVSLTATVQPPLSTPATASAAPVPHVAEAAAAAVEPAPRPAEGVTARRTAAGSRPEAGGGLLPAEAGSHIDTFVETLLRMSQQPASGRVEFRDHDPRVNVLSGPNAGRSLPIGSLPVTMGRVGDGVAVIRPKDGGYVLMPARGEKPPRLDGAEVPADGVALRGGETFEVAGVRLEYVATARSTIARSGESAATTGK